MGAVCISMFGVMRSAYYTLRSNRDLCISGLLRLRNLLAANDDTLAPLHAGECEIHFRSTARHDVGDSSSRTAAHGPSKRAVPGVEKQVGVAALADIRDVGWRQRP